MVSTAYRLKRRQIRHGAGPDSAHRIGRRIGSVYAGPEGEPAGSGHIGTLIFDEVDAGVGGAVAEALACVFINSPNLVRCSW
ncbi:MAG: hypothetical protein CM15mP21_0910 [Hyphomicrobiales bacterium]|nr:MAG: hypothetical protein CM15mP21_0910 [Hyphomicrobiales bacterium]